MLTLGALMESEIEEQIALLPVAARRYAAELESLIGGRTFDLVLIAARGSSDNAALYARYLIEVFLGIPVVLAAPSVLTRYGRHVRYPNCLAIGVSQSGAAPDVAEVMAAMRQAGHYTLAITNTEDSRLTRECEGTLLLGAGLERSVAATKTYSATLLAFYSVVRALGADLSFPDELPNLAWLDAAREAAQEISGPVVRCQPLFALGRGFGFSTAHETALKLMECALLPCKAYSSADFEHGPKALAGAGSAVLSYDGEMQGLSDQGAEILLAPTHAAPEVLKPIWDVIFGQLLALAAARARGLNPDRPRHLKKVTETL